MILYYDEMQSTFSELKLIEQDLLQVYNEFQDLYFDPRDVFSLLELTHIRFSEIEDRIVNLSVPEMVEDRKALDEIRLSRNPLLLIQVWKGCNTALRSPLDPTLAARLHNLHL